MPETRDTKSCSSTNEDSCLLTMMREEITSPMPLMVSNTFFSEELKFNTRLFMMMRGVHASAQTPFATECLHASVFDEWWFHLEVKVAFRRNVKLKIESPPICSCRSGGL